MATQSLNNETTSNNRENALFLQRKKFKKWMALMCIGTRERGHNAATVTQAAIG